MDALAVAGNAGGEGIRCARKPNLSWDAYKWAIRPSRLMHLHGPHEYVTRCAEALNGCRQVPQRIVFLMVHYFSEQKDSSKKHTSIHTMDSSCQTSFAHCKAAVKIGIDANINAEECPNHSCDPC